MKYKDYTIKLDFKTGLFHAFNFKTLTAAQPTETMEEMRTAIDAKEKEKEKEKEKK